VGGITHIEKEKEMETETQNIDVTNIDDINLLKSIIASLKSNLIIMTVDRDNNKSMRIEGRQKHERDITLIGEALLKEADDRDWCSAYDDFIEELNESLSVELKRREHEYEVEIEVTQKRTQRVTVTVTAQSEEDARETIESDPSSFYENKVNDYDWELEDEDSDILDITRE
jgi:hypothetical protein